MDDKEVRLINASKIEIFLHQMRYAAAKHGMDYDVEIINIILETVEHEPTIEAEPDNGWISVDDRLPPYGERVLVVNEAYETERGYTKYNYNCGVTVREPHLNFTFLGHKVTHWQPLPKPPKEGAK